MKRILFMIILFFPLLPVQAKEYYTDYSNWKEVETVPNLESDLMEVKQTDEYLWCKRETEGAYFKQEETPLEYTIKTPFYRYTEWSDWSLEVPSLMENRNIESRKLYYIRKMLPIKWIRFTDVSIDTFAFETIEIYKGTREISFEWSTDQNTILLHLSEPCYMDELDMMLLMSNKKEELKQFKIEWLYDLNTESAMDVLSHFWFNQFYEKHYQYQDMRQNLILWEEEPVVSLEKEEENLHQMVWVEEEYRYQDRMDYYEKEVKICSEEYSHQMIDGYPYKEESSKKSHIEIRTRERVQKELLEKNTIKEVFLPVYKTLQIPNVVCDNETLKTELTEANATIMALKNEEENESIPKKIEIKKQSFKPSILYFLFLFIGLVSGRILTMKKKF